jgi:hypothetical protein
MCIELQSLTEICNNYQCYLTLLTLVNVCVFCLSSGLKYHLPVPPWRLNNEGWRAHYLWIYRFIFSPSLFCSPQVWVSVFVTDINIQVFVSATLLYIEHGRTDTKARISLLKNCLTVGVVRNEPGHRVTDHDMAGHLADTQNTNTLYYER